MTAFVRFCEAETGRRFAGATDFHRFSVEELRRFWSLLLRFSGLRVEGEAEPVCVGDEIETACFFPNLRLSYAENLLASRAPGDDAALALVACDETGCVARWTRGELRRAVIETALGLQALGIGPGDRVAALARNGAEPVIAALAATAIGAVWSSVAPDLGDAAVRSRFEPLAPKLLFTHRRQRHQGQERSLDARAEAVLAALPTVETVVSLDAEALPEPGPRASTTLDAVRALGRDGGGVDDFAWPRFPFSHPLFILFSSGTTGAPKCIVHGAGGTLLEHWKELRLHTDLGTDDVLFFHTSCGWMMWNWQLSALSCGTAIVVYDGSVSYPEPDALFRLVSRERVSVFGTSPAFLQYARDAGLSPKDALPLDALRAMLSTGSILYDAQYDFVAEHVKALPLQSISGGTDILGCFVLGHPALPVHRGESQTLSLGLDVRSLGAGEGPGDLVCARPFPSRPLGLFGDADGRRFHEAYFSQNPGMWTHGDFLELTAHGGARILGRSDGVLNIRGVRIGPAELYNVLQGFPEIAEAMAVEQQAPREPGGVRLVLLVVMQPGHALDRPLTLRIKKELSQRLSPNHVPAAVAAVTALPMTHNGKRSERAAKDTLDGLPARNLSALRNPECLEAIRTHPALCASPPRAGAGSIS